VPRKANGPRYSTPEDLKAAVEAWAETEAKRLRWSQDREPLRRAVAGWSVKIRHLQRPARDIHRRLKSAIQAATKLEEEVGAQVGGDAWVGRVVGLLRKLREESPGFLSDLELDWTPKHDEPVDVRDLSPRTRLVHELARLLPKRNKAGRVIGHVYTGEAKNEEDLVILSVRAGLFDVSSISRKGMALRPMTLRQGIEHERVRIRQAVLAATGEKRKQRKKRGLIRERLK
jgi:hypothetical protein